MTVCTIKFGDMKRDKESGLPYIDIYAVDEEGNVVHNGVISAVEMKPGRISIKLSDDYNEPITVNNNYSIVSNFAKVYNSKSCMLLIYSIVSTAVYMFMTYTIKQCAINLKFINFGNYDDKYWERDKNFYAFAREVEYWADERFTLFYPELSSIMTGQKNRDESFADAVKSTFSLMCELSHIFAYMGKTLLFSKL